MNHMKLTVQQAVEGIRFQVGARGLDEGLGMVNEDAYLGKSYSEVIEKFLAPIMIETSDNTEIIQKVMEANKPLEYKIIAIWHLACVMMEREYSKTGIKGFLDYLSKSLSDDSKRAIKEIKRMCDDDDDDYI